MNALDGDRRLTQDLYRTGYVDHTDRTFIGRIRKREFGTRFGISIRPRSQDNVVVLDPPDAPQPGISTGTQPPFDAHPNFNWDEDLPDSDDGYKIWRCWKLPRGTLIPASLNIILDRPNHATISIAAATSVSLSRSGRNAYVHAVADLDWQHHSIRMSAEAAPVIKALQDYEHADAIRIAITHVLENGDTDEVITCLTTCEAILDCEDIITVLVQLNEVFKAYMNSGDFHPDDDYCVYVAREFTQSKVGYASTLKSASQCLDVLILKLLVNAGIMVVLSQQTLVCSRVRDC